MHKHTLHIVRGSSPKEVQAWLQANGFDAVATTALNSYDGAQLLSQTPEQLKQIAPGCDKWTCHMTHHMWTSFRQLSPFLSFPILYVCAGGIGPSYVAFLL